MKLILFALLLAGCATAPKPLPNLTANADAGVLSGLRGDVVVIPQWHLAANTNTVVSSANLPQGENQHAIYRQLVEWAETGAITNVIVEGCEGEITDGFRDRFNGWTLDELQKLSPERLDEVMTQVGLKLKAKVGRKVHVMCGDSNALIKKHQLILSDLRGFLGFKIRIEEFKSDIKKRADYVATVRDLMKMDADSDEIDVLTKLDEQLRQKLKEFNDTLHERNALFVAKAKELSKPEAIVIGVIHVEDLKQQLEHDAGLTTVTFTPKGLRGDEAELLDQIKELLDKSMPPRGPHQPTPPPHTQVGPRAPVKSPPPPEQSN